MKTVNPGNHYNSNREVSSVEIHNSKSEEGLYKIDWTNNPGFDPNQTHTIAANATYQTGTGNKGTVTVTNVGNVDIEVSSN